MRIVSEPGTAGAGGRSRRTMVAAALLAAVAFPTLSAAPPARLAVGEPLPDLVLPRVGEGGAHPLRSLVGGGRKTLLIAFASW